MCHDAKEWFKEKLEKHAFFVWFNGLERSVEGTLKVYGKSLVTVLDEVPFIVNLYIFSLPCVPQANLSFPKVSRLPPSQEEQLAKLFFY